MVKSKVPITSNGSFVYQAASFSNVNARPPPPPAQTAQSIQSHKYDEDNWEDYFPHNFDYGRITLDFTLEELLAYFNPDDWEAIGIEEGDEVYKRDLVRQFREAARLGWHGADTLDEGPAEDFSNEEGPADAKAIENENEDPEEDEDQETSAEDLPSLSKKKTKKSSPQKKEKKPDTAAEKRRKLKMKIACQKMNKQWDAFLEQFDDPLVKAAAKVGYLARKKQDCLRLDKPFYVCMHGVGPGPGCLTNQYSADRVRSAISNFFGRNKKQTFQIPGMMKWCRKHYQQDGYKDETWQKTKRRHILAQLDRNELDLRRDGFEGLTYEIRLRGKDDARIRAWRDGKGEKGSPTKGDKHPAPIETLDHIYTHFCDKRRSLAECRALVQWAFTDYTKRYAEWAEGREARDVAREAKANAPKFVEFQMLPEYERWYSRGELEEREKAGSPRKRRGVKGEVEEAKFVVATMETVGRKRGADGEVEGIPSKKARRG